MTDAAKLHTGVVWFNVAFSFPSFGGRVKLDMLTPPCPSALGSKSPQGFYVANNLSDDSMFRKDF